MMRRRIPSQRSDTWAIQAARNAMGIIQHLIEPNEKLPVIKIEDMAARIRKAFPDRQAWNQAVHESILQPEEKIWLIVP